jgi:hypothetical protein
MCYTLFVIRNEYGKRSERLPYSNQTTGMSGDQAQYILAHPQPRWNNITGVICLTPKERN